jgi:CRP/FNR family cyclic AMP-dependent transcriptional regulator
LCAHPFTHPSRTGGRNGTGVTIHAGEAIIGAPLTIKGERVMSVKVLGVFKNAKETREVPAGTVIFEEGSAGEEMFGIVTGRVELRMANGHAYSLGPDETFGEMAVVDGSARSATAVAVEDSTIAMINKHRFLFLVGETPSFALQVMASLAERLRAAQSDGKA